MKASTLLAVTLLRNHPEGLTRSAALMGCGNLPARVAEARAAGYGIDDEPERTEAGAQIKRWFLVSEPRAFTPTSGVQEGMALT